MSRKNIALIGIGYWGKVHLKYLKKNKNINIKYIVFKKNKKNLLDPKLKKYKLTNNLKLVLNDKSIDCIDLVTPIDTHSFLTEKCILKNKSVLVEKPLIMKNFQEKFFKKKSNLITVSYPYLYSETLNEGKKIIKRGIIGKLKFIEISIQQCGRFNKFNVFELLAPHAISIFSKFFDIQNIKFEKKVLIEKNKKPQTAIIECYKNKKLVCIINISLNYGNEDPNKKVIIYCDNGNIFCDLKKKMNNFTVYKYNKKDNHKSINLKKIIKKTYNENDNVNKVIKNFLKKNKKDNFKLTAKINDFLK